MKFLLTLAVSVFVLDSTAYEIDLDKIMNPPGFETTREINRAHQREVELFYRNEAIRLQESKPINCTSYELYGTIHTQCN